MDLLEKYSIQRCAKYVVVIARTGRLYSPIGEPMSGGVGVTWCRLGDGDARRKVRLG